MSGQAVKPRIIWDAKDHPALSSGYANVTKHLVPRLADHYGKENIFIYAPVFNREHLEDYQGVTILPGEKSDYEEPLLLQHYQRLECNLLITVGDTLQLRQIPTWAAEDKVLWVAWAAWDYMNLPAQFKEILRFPVRIVPFSKYGERKLKEAGLVNVGPAIWLGLDPNLWQPVDPQEFPLIRRQLDFTDSTFNIVMVQANQERKCLREALEAIALFRQTHPDANTRLYLHSRMLGERNLEIDLLELGLMGPNGCTAMPDDYQMEIGGLAEGHMAAIINCADVVLDICQEGFGLSHTQANACGVPVIYLNEGAGPELVRFGVEVPTYSVDRRWVLGKAVPNPAHIAEALEMLYLKRREHGEPLRDLSASTWVRETFSWDKIAQQWIAVIDEMMELRWRYSYEIPSPSEELLARSRQVVELS